MKSNGCGASDPTERPPPNDRYHPVGYPSSSSSAPSVSQFPKSHLYQPQTVHAHEPRHQFPIHPSVSLQGAAVHPGAAFHQSLVHGGGVSAALSKCYL